LVSKSFIEVDKVRQRVESLTNDTYGQKFINLTIDRLNLPKDTVSHYIRFKVSNYYNMREQRFDKDLSIYRLVSASVKYLGFLIMTFLYSSTKTDKNKKHNFTLLIDDIQSSNEIERWIPLEKEFKDGNTVFISRADIDNEESRNLFYRPFLKGYSREMIKSKYIKLALLDLPKVIYYSLKLNFNLLFIYTHLINDYMYFYSLFKTCTADYLIQDRNLGTTNPIKNYLFKESGGLITSCLQKNIIQHNGTGLFYDIDIFFTFGNKTGEEALKLGGNVGKIHPVGSLSMNNALKSYEEKSEFLYDVLYVGLNTESKRTDWDGYYRSIAWLAKLADENSNLKIAIKHHATWRGDNREQDLIRNSKVFHVDASENSYISGLKSKIVLTYGSSMLYEFMAFKKNIYFLDPGLENPFINNFVYSDNIVLESYDKLKMLVQNNRIHFDATVEDANDYCHPNADISKSISNILKLESLGENNIV